MRSSGRVSGGAWLEIAEHHQSGEGVLAEWVETVTDGGFRFKSVLLIWHRGVLGGRYPHTDSEVVLEELRSRQCSLTEVLRRAERPLTI